MNAHHDTGSQSAGPHGSGTAPTPGEAAPAQAAAQHLPAPQAATQHLPAPQAATQHPPAPQAPTEQLPVPVREPALVGTAPAATPAPAAQPGPAGRPHQAASPHYVPGAFPLQGGAPQQPTHQHHQQATYQPGGVPPQPPGATPVPGATPQPPRQRRTWPAVATAALVAAVLAAGGTAAATGAFSREETPSSSYSDLGSAPQSDVPTTTDGSVDWEAVAASVQSSVVAIAVSSTQGEVAGSGVIIDSSGYLVTNNHVVEGAGDGDITVRLSDGRLYEASIVGTDPTTDIAVIQLVDPPDDLSAATLGDSSAVAVGEAVMAVGNPLGLDNTVTTGIVSALDRPVTTSEDGTAASAVVTNAIQVDAAINPGNSGGPLFNAAGEVIGINSSIASMPSATGESSGSIGLGFAIPINQVRDVADQLIEDGTAEHAFLGVTLSDATATVDGVTRQGAEVQDVTEGTPAADAGLQPGDVIVGIDGKPVGGAESLTGFVRQYSAGDEVTLTVVRDGEATDVTATLATRPADSETSGEGDQGSGSEDPGQLPQLPGLPWGGDG